MKTLTINNSKNEQFIQLSMEMNRRVIRLQDGDGKLVAALYIDGFGKLHPDSWIKTDEKEA